MLSGVMRLELAHSPMLRSRVYRYPDRKDELRELESTNSYLEMRNACKSDHRCLELLPTTDGKVET
jgi:hypothetical protein